MKLRWLNHAAYEVSHAGAVLVTDPWLWGDAFDHGWQLLCPTVYTPEDFDVVTHIWFSHEHPDHFSPPNLKRIPVASRARITILFQKTADGRVAEHCRKLGFKAVVELRPDAVHTVADDFTIQIAPVSHGDSWSCIRVGGLSLLNMNDCIVDEGANGPKIAAVVGAVDVLFTQFSYAQRIGNPEDIALREAAAARKLKRMAAQISLFEPKCVVPFASFVWFSHVENFAQNLGANSVAAAAAFIEACGVTPVVLYPDDRWDLRTAVDNSSALARYAADLATVPDRPRTPSTSVDEAALIEQHAAFMARLGEKNGRWLLESLKLGGIFRETTVYLNDLHRRVRFDLKAITFEDGAAEGCDIALSSAALGYCFRFEWGGDTLNINARFTLPGGGSHAHFRRYFALSNLNNKGQTIAGYLPIARARLRGEGAQLGQNLRGVMKLNLRKHAAGILRPAFLKGTFHGLVGDAAAEMALRFAYGSRMGRWLKANPLEPQFEHRFDLYADVLRNEALDGPIDYLEFGVAEGRSIRWWVEQVRNKDARFVGFDCFTGLPEDWQWHEKGAFDQGGKTPDIKDDRVSWQVGYFQESLPGFIKARTWGERRLVVHLDADLFSSTLFVLGNLAPHLKVGDVVIFDEFTRLTDATHEFRAFHDFLNAYGMEFSVLGAASGYVQVAMRVEGAIGSAFA